MQNLETVIDTTTGTIMDVISMEDTIPYYGSNEIVADVVEVAPITGRGTKAVFIVN